jgi:ceramide glucosyltransferase
MILRRADLSAIGGFRGLVDHLADDYHLGNRIHGLGRRIELSTIPVDCWDPPAGWASVWAHQVRWTRTVRVCQPLPFAASLLSNGSLWAFLWLGVALALSAAWWPAAALLALRAYLAAVLYRRLRRGLTGHAAPWRVWLKDLLGVALWATAFLGDQIVWRGTRFRVLRDGRLAPMT